MAKKNEKQENPLGDIANLVLGKLDEHGVTLEQALSAITTASKKAEAEKSPAKKAAPKSTAVITEVDGKKMNLSGDIKRNN